MKTRLPMIMSGAITLFVSSANAHISVVSGNATANVTQVVKFGVGHGCDGADTYRVQIEIPAGITSVRPMTSDLGRATVQANAAGVATAVTWQKADADALPADTNYYELNLRLKPPDSPFTTLYFRIHQTCRAANGTLSTVDWVALPGATGPDGGPAPEPAAALNLVPAHLPGWNSFTVTQNVADLSVFFRDAQIVWRDTAGYSYNASTQQLIMTTPGVTALASLAAGDRIWVKY